MKDRSRAWVIDALETARHKLGIALWAYVIMPEHVHVLLCPKHDDYEMRRILASLKRPVSVAARAYLEEIEDDRWLARLTVEFRSRAVFRFWQPGGGYDHNIFREKTVPGVIDYIHANPMRRGFVQSPIDWPWSSARFWSGCDIVPIRMDQPPF